MKESKWYFVRVIITECNNVDDVKIKSTSSYQDARRLFLNEINENKILGVNVSVFGNKAAEAIYCDGSKESLFIQKEAK